MIVTDIDGVVADLNPEVIYRARKAGFKINESVVSAPNYLWEDLSDQITEEWVQAQFKDPTFWLNAKPYEDVWYWLNHHSSEHEIIAVSHRPADMLSYSYRWFYDWDMPVDKIYHGRDKKEVLSEIGASIFVEDFFPIAEAIAYATDISTYLIDRPYNQFDLLESKLNRIYSVWEIQL